MNDFLLNIDYGIINIDIESSFIDHTASRDNTEFTIDSNDMVLVVESAIINNIDNLEIQRYNDYNLVLTNTVYANLPDEIPMSIISGNLPVNRIDGLDEYLSTIPVDGGSP